MVGSRLELVLSNFRGLSITPLPTEERRVLERSMLLEIRGRPFYNS